MQDKVKKRPSDEFSFGLVQTRVEERSGVEDGGRMTEDGAGSAKAQD